MEIQGPPSKYNISQLMYPSDLMDPVYGGNMVMFYINVADASKFKPSPNQLIDMSLLDTPSMRGLTLARPIGEVNAVLSAVGSGLGFPLAGAIASGWGDIKKAVGAAGVLSAVGLGAASEIAKTTTREQKRLTSAIALHMPNELSIRYSVGWESEDMGGAEMLSILGESGIAAAKALSETSISSMIENVKGATISGVANSTGGEAAASMAISKGAGGAYVGLRTGLAANPRKEMVFKGVDFRTFTFSYSFFPRSEPEALIVENIINTFKFHMHPEYKDSNSFLYLYPSEFDISYQTSSGVNTHIHKHTSCVLTELTVNYAPQGSFNVFANGMPTQINISMAFKELDMPTKETIKMGL